MYTINQYCVGCHYCADECPVSAINFVGTKYEIDPGRCTSCGSCVSLCPISAISDPEHPVPPAPQHPPIERYCDVVVLGGGCGLIAAVRAAEAGKKVILLEKAKKVGGNTDLAHMFFPLYPQVFAEQGLPDVREDAIEILHDRSKQVVEKDILRAAVYGCSDFFDWFSRFKGVSEAFEVQKLGGVIAEGPIIGPAMLNFPRRRLENLKCRDQAIGPGWAGTFIKHTMVRECKRLGVEIYTEHRAVQLLTGERGEINGVLADDPGGRTRINCKSCIIATGGMGRSDEKLKKYFPDFFDDKTPILRFSVPTDTGDGIDLAEPLGARIPRDRMYCSVFGPAHHPFSYVIYRFMRRPECVYINLKGKRWLNEELEILGGMHSIHLQPRAVSFGVMSQRMVDAAADFFINDPMARQEAWIFKDYQRDLDEETALGFPVRKGATLEELALKMEVDPGVFTAEIQRYNRMCAEGRDEDFGKDPRFLIPLDDEGPYYGFYGQRFSEGTFGGLAVNPATEVINQDGKSIPGLYGVGDATSAVQVRGNLAVVSELTWATASAYLAGANTAAFCDTEGGKRSNYESRH